MKSHCKFRDKHGLGVPLLSDEAGTLIEEPRPLGREVDVRPQVHGYRAGHPARRPRRHRRPSLAQREGSGPRRGGPRGRAQSSDTAAASRIGRLSAEWAFAMAHNSVSCVASRSRCFLDKGHGLGAGPAITKARWVKPHGGTFTTAERVPFGAISRETPFHSVGELHPIYPPHAAVAARRRRRHRFSSPAGWRSRPPRWPIDRIAAGDGDQAVAIREAFRDPHRGTRRRARPARGRGALGAGPVPARHGAGQPAADGDPAVGRGAARTVGGARC